MLSPTDIHYVSALLMQAWEGAEVDLELGSMVYDYASEKLRDIDITIRDKNDLHVFKGIEVKKHGKALDVADVEQLCIKFQDMRDVSYKAIVSASGYTKAAIKKATKHGVDLFELVPWVDYDNEVSNLIFMKERFSANEYSHEWIEIDHPQITVSPEDRKILEGAKFDDLIVCTKEGVVPKKVYPALNLMGLTAYDALRQYSINKYGNFDKGPGVYEERVILPCRLSEPVYFKYNNHIITITGYNFSGKARFTVVEQRFCFKILIKIGEQKPFVGCALFELSNGGLVGVTTTKENPFQIIKIPKTDRIKNKIYKQKISNDVIVE